MQEGCLHSSPSFFQEYLTGFCEFDLLSKPTPEVSAVPNVPTVDYAASLIERVYFISLQSKILKENISSYYKVITNACEIFGATYCYF